ncbi:cytochrome P450 [Nocardia brevicatena]|uniref:cytochrome P450 n=1 Tax=Nocardia brevicatena TaxID=37327 RepID=UPI0002F0357C|nr:cytochrome P450 [Nocardia brevicatena]
MQSQSLHDTSAPRISTAHSYPSIEDLGLRYRMYDQAFAQDPHATYQRMRTSGRTLVPVLLAPDVPATLVIGYETAKRILNDDDRFPADPRTWQQTLPAQHPLRPMMEYRPNPLRTTGDVHGRYRKALNAGLSVIDLHYVRAATARTAIPLINRFCRDGNADLISQYITPLTIAVLTTDIMGCPPELVDDVLTATAAMFDIVDTVEVEAMLGSALGALMASKCQCPAHADVTANLVHTATDLSHEEKLNQLVTLLTAGIEVPRNHIANTILLMLTDPRYRHNEAGFAPPVTDAMVEILTTDPPMANYYISYPRARTLIDGVWLPANQPVVISMAAANNDPKLRRDTDSDWNYGGGNGWHPGYGAGRHRCPAMARQSSELIVAEAIGQLLDALPDMRPAVPREHLTLRPGPFHRALTALPVVFPPASPLPIP